MRLVLPVTYICRQAAIVQTLRPGFEDKARSSLPGSVAASNTTWLKLNSPETKRQMSTDPVAPKDYLLQDLDACKGLTTKSQVDMVGSRHGTW